MAEDSIFSKIVRGELPCYKLYEDDKTLAFLDINPSAPGHCLVIPKDQYANIDDAPAETLSAMIATVQKVGAAVKKAVGAPAYNLLCNNGKEAGQIVFHVHFHIIPRKPGDGIRFGFKHENMDEAGFQDMQARITKEMAG